MIKRELLEYFNGDEMIAQIWLDKYALKDKQGVVLETTPLDMHIRLAKEFSRIEQNYPNPIEYDEILALLTDNIILPGGSLLYGIGNNHSISSLGNCFVIGNKADSYGGICTIDQEQIQLMKRRAGVGHDISHLRSKKSLVTNSAGSSTGAVSFMDRYSNSTREVAQGGRRGALMLTMDIDHPDIEEFITSKDDTTKLTGANISVKIHNHFMNLAEADLKNVATRDDYSDYVKVHKIWGKLIHQAWKSAEPGVLFWDKIIEESPADCYEEFESISTNPLT